jgi:cytochrome c oxidase subunit 2
MTWNKIMYNQEKGEIVEVYAYQFGWIVRYSGVDNTLEKQIIKWFLHQIHLGVITEKQLKIPILKLIKE